MKNSTQNTAKMTALVTGASSGIGYELAKILARNGYNLVLVARSQKQLAELATELENNYNISVYVLVKDLSKDGAAQEIFDELSKASIHVDVLVNNAGFTNYGFFTETNLQSELNMMHVNMISLMHLTKLFLPRMIERGEGKIMNVASIAAFLPGPLMANYYATKAYVLHFSEALLNELQGSGVTVTALCPGPTQSGFQERGGLGDIRLMEGKIPTSESVAKVGYRGMMNGKAIVIPGLGNKLLAFSIRFSPRGIVGKIVRYLQESRATA